MQETYTRKFVELDLSQNLQLRPKDEREFLLHCVIVEPTEMCYQYDSSDDVKHDGVFVDHAFRDMIEKYEIKIEDFWILIDSDSS